MMPAPLYWPIDIISLINTRYLHPGSPLIVILLNALVGVGLHHDLEDEIALGDLLRPAD